MAVGEYGNCGPAFSQTLGANPQLITADTLIIRNETVYPTFNSIAAVYYRQ